MFDYKNIPDGTEDDEMEQYLKRFLGEKEDIVKNKGVMYALEQLEYIAEKEIMTEYCKADIGEVSNFIIQHLDYNDASRMDLILTITVQMSLVDVWNVIINKQNIADRKVLNLIRETANEIMEYKYTEFMDKCYKRTVEIANEPETNMDKQNSETNQRKMNELLKERAKWGILVFKILLIVVLLFDIIYIIVNETAAIISFSILAVLCGLFILYFKKVYKDPEKYQRFFFNLNTTRVSNARLWANKRDKEDYKYDKEYGFVSSLFNRKISVSAINVSKEYVERCIDFFQTLNEEEIRVLTEEAIQYCNECRVLFDFEEANIDIPESITGKEILEYIYPHAMYIGSDMDMNGGDMYVGGEEKGDPEKIEFIVECDCDWEEHGLEIIVIDNKILHVGFYEGDLEKYHHGNNI